MVRIGPEGFGRRVREARERLSLTQEQLARLAEVDRKTVNRWEQERGRGARSDELYRLARALGESTDYLAAAFSAAALHLRALADHLEATPADELPTGDLPVVIPPIVGEPREDQTGERSGTR